MYAESLITELYFEAVSDTVAFIGQFDSGDVLRETEKPARTPWRRTKLSCTIAVNGCTERRLHG